MSFLYRLLMFLNNNNKTRKLSQNKALLSHKNKLNHKKQLKKLTIL